MKDSVLITSAGRRASLLDAFIQAAAERDWRVLAGDHDALAPTLYLAHRGICLPAIQSPGYIDYLLRAVEEEAVRLIVPTIDTELLPLALNAARFKERGCIALVSSPEFVTITADKWHTAQFFAAKGITVPASWLPENCADNNLPNDLFLKPRNGSASKDAFAINRDSLARMLPLVPNAIIQERLVGDEITVDSLLDLGGRPIHFVPRRRLRTLGGESIQGVTIDDGALRDWILRILGLASQVGAIGPLTIQAFITPDGPVLTEINPRFGGGFPLTRAAGGDYPTWITRAVNGERLNACFGNFRRHLYMSRYYIEYFTESPLWEQ
jgi:carbamoyl-phosphate synthase large subunit